MIYAYDVLLHQQNVSIGFYFLLKSILSPIRLSEISHEPGGRLNFRGGDTRVNKGDLRKRL